MVRSDQQVVRGLCSQGFMHHPLNGRSILGNFVPGDSPTPTPADQPHPF